MILAGRPSVSATIWVGAPAVSIDQMVRWSGSAISRSSTWLPFASTSLISAVAPSINCT